MATTTTTSRHITSTRSPPEPLRRTSGGSRRWGMPKWRPPQNCSAGSATGYALHMSAPRRSATMSAVPIDAADEVVEEAELSLLTTLLAALVVGGGLAAAGRLSATALL